MNPAGSLSSVVGTTSVSDDMATALHQLALAAIGDVDVNEFLRKAVLVAARLTDSPHATILLLDEPGERILYRIRLDGGNVAPLELVAGPMMSRGLAGLVARERRAVLVDDTEQDARWLPGPGLGDLRSAIVAPLSCADRTLGIITLGHHVPAHYAEQHLRLVEIVAVQIALVVALDRALRPERQPAGLVSAEQRQVRSDDRDLPGRPLACDLVALSAGLRGLNVVGDSLSIETFFGGVLQAFFESLTDAIQRYEGWVDHFGSDSVLAIFEGEGGSQRAVQAALQMQAAARRLRAQWRDQLSFKVGTLDIGIAHGRAIVGRLGLGSARPRAVGDVVEQAARLRELARGGEILVSDRVAAALQPTTSIVVRALPPLPAGAQISQQIFNVGVAAAGRPAPGLALKSSDW